jgi:pyruvate/2-oxoglutarate dehydrogenase complex dihydrolipoamide acyltransferase (E2) component
LKEYLKICKFVYWIRIQCINIFVKKTPSKAEGQVGGVISIYSALGTSSDIDQFTEIIMYSQLAVMSVAKESTQVVPDAISGKPVIAKRVVVTLSVDASVVDEDSAAKFLTAFQTYVNSPSSILLANTF